MTRPKSTLPLFVRLALWWGVLMFFACAIFLFAKSLYLVNYGKHIVATVIENKKTEDHMYAPVFQFTTPNGQTISATSTTSSQPAAYKIGDRVSLLYLPDHPENAQEETFFSLWFGGIFFLVAAIALAIAIRWIIRKTIPRKIDHQLSPQ